MLAVIVAFLLAGVVRKAPPGAGTALIILALAPLAIPTIFLAVGVYNVYVSLGLVGNELAVAFAQALTVLPFAFLTIMNGLQSYDPRIDSAAASLGARPARRFVRVKLPLLAPAVLAATALAFLFAFDELIVTLLVSGVGFYTLPVRMFAGAQQNVSPELAAVGSLVVAGAVIGGAVLAVIIRRVGHGERLMTLEPAPDGPRAALSASPHGRQAGSD
jgi:ABC-type spermidine/putrescine transport system permease subunit II